MSNKICCFSPVATRSIPHPLTTALFRKEELKGQRMLKLSQVKLLAIFQMCHLFANQKRNQFQFKDWTLALHLLARTCQSDSL